MRELVTIAVIAFILGSRGSRARQRSFEGAVSGLSDGDPAPIGIGGSGNETGSAAFGGASAVSGVPAITTTPGKCGCP